MYDYTCTSCTPSDSSDLVYGVLKGISELEREELCPVCGKPMSRVIQATALKLRADGRGIHGAPFKTGGGKKS